jgi:hypothetical protein
MWSRNKTSNPTHSRTQITASQVLHIADHQFHSPPVIIRVEGDVAEMSGQTHLINKSSYFSTIPQ